mgnify:FL=1
MDMEVEDPEPEFFKPENKGFFSLLIESFKFFTLNLPAIATIVIPVFLLAEILVPIIEIFYDDLAEGATSWDWVNIILNNLIKSLISALIYSILAGIAYIAVIRVIAGAMHGEKLSPIQAMKDAIQMLPMFVVTALLYHLAYGFGLVLLVVPGIVLFVWFHFWQFSYVLRGKGAVSGLMYSKSIVDDNFVRVFLYILGIWLFMSLMNSYGIDLIADLVASNVGEEGDIGYILVNAVLVGLGRVLEGIRIIFLMTLFMDLEKD